MNQIYAIYCSSEHIHVYTRPQTIRLTVCTRKLHNDTCSAGCALCTARMKYTCDEQVFWAEVSAFNGFLGVQRSEFYALNGVASKHREI